MAEWGKEDTIIEEPVETFGGEDAFREEPLLPTTVESTKRQAENIVGVSAQKGLSLNDAEEAYQRSQLKETYRGHLARGWLKTAIGFANVPADMTRLFEKGARGETTQTWISAYAPVNRVSSEGFKKINAARKDPKLPITNLVQKGTDWLTEGAEYYIEKHPEWAGEPPEGFLM